MRRHFAHRAEDVRDVPVHLPRGDGCVRDMQLPLSGNLQLHPARFYIMGESPMQIEAQMLKRWPENPCSINMEKVRRSPEAVYQH